MSKKILSVVLSVVLLAVFPLSLASCGEANPDQVTLNVFNWGEYISNGEDGSLDVIAEFEKQTGIKVNYTTYETNEALYNKMKTGGVSYDVIIPSDYMIGKMIQENMLEKLDFSNIPNYELIDDRFKSSEIAPYDPEGAYSVPYTWGRVGLIYNTKYVTEPVNSWNILWDEAYKNQILMFDNPRDAFGIAQFLLGQSVNTEDTAELEAAAALLQKQSAVSPVYAMDQILEKMPNEDAYIAPYYVGDCLTMCDENEDLTFTVPQEGTNLFLDAMCIPKGTKHKKEAEQFINFMCSTEVAYANIEYIAYSSPQVEAAAQHKEYLVQEYGDEIAQSIYPADLSNTQVFLTLSQEAEQMMTDLWVKVKTAN